MSGDNNSETRNLRARLERYEALGLPDPDEGLIHALNDEGFRLLGSKGAVEHFQNEHEKARAEADKWHSRVATLEMIGSSLLHRHKMSEVDWKTFKALEEYFRIHGPKSDELEK